MKGLLFTQVNKISNQLKKYPYEMVEIKTNLQLGKVQQSFYTLIETY